MEAFPEERDWRDGAELKEGRSVLPGRTRGPFLCERLSCRSLRTSVREKWHQTVSGGRSV